MCRPNRAAVYLRIPLRRYRILGLIGLPSIFVFTRATTETPNLIRFAPIFITVNAMRIHKVQNKLLPVFCKSLMRRIPKIVFGLRYERLNEWREVLKEEGRSMGPKQWWHLLREATRALLYPVSRNKYLHRLVTCHRCPLYDKQLKRCRPYTGAPVGCGCFVPYRAVSPAPCWLRERFPDQGWD